MNDSNFVMGHKFIHFLHFLRPLIWHLHRWRWVPPPAAAKCIKSVHSVPISVSGLKSFALRCQIIEIVPVKVNALSELKVRSLHFGGHESACAQVSETDSGSSA